MIKIVRDIWHIPELRRRIMWTLGLLVIYRLGFYIYLPGIDIEAFEKQQREGGGGLLDWLLYTRALTGGSFTPFLFSLGIMPYISASIIFSLMIKVFPRLEALSKEGEQGRRQINRYTRYSTVLLCLVQSLFLVSSWGTDPGDGSTVTANPGFFISVLQVMCLTVGSVFLMWLGEKITEVGIGNGTSLIIMAGIVAQMPAAFATLGKKIIFAQPEQMPFEVVTALTFLGLYIGVVAVVVFITKGQRRIPIQQQRSVKGRRVYGGQRQYMPIKVLAAGVLPIIFAQSLMVIPSGIMSYFAYGGSSESILYRFLGAVASAFNYGGFLYLVAYVVMIFFFTYFWTGLMFNPVEIANNMKEYGSFIPGIRPGKRTAEYLERVLKRITLAGASFLTCVALIPQMVSRAMEIDLFVSTFLGGTGILIVVGVALDLDDKIEAQLLVRQYEGFVRGGGTGAGAGVRQKKPTL